MLLLAMQRLDTPLTVLFVCVRLFTVDLTPAPKPTDPVTDTAQMLQPKEREKLDRYLLQYSREKGSQIAVLTVSTVGPEAPFDYLVRVMEGWKLGRRDVGGDVLLLLARDERKAHLVMGHGLGGAIPDVYAKRVLQDVLSPYLCEGKTGESVVAMVTQTEKLIIGEKLPRTSTQSDIVDDRMDSLLILLAVLSFIGAFLKMRFDPTVSNLLTGSSSFGAAPMLDSGVQTGLVAGLIMTVPTLIGFSDLFRTVKIFVSGGGGDGGGWHSGEGDGSRHDDRGGGLSGGGGSFGGDGTSRGW